MIMDWSHDRDGTPIFGSNEDYISSRYPPSVHDILHSLGVDSPNWTWVCEQLRKLHNAGKLHDFNRPKEWYSDLAKVILSAKDSQRGSISLNDLSEIPLIPLEDGTWRTAPSETDPIYFPASLGTTIPPGLPLTVVTLEACSCVHQMGLFELLGVKSCNVDVIVERILHHHRTLTMNGSPAAGNANTNLVAQVKYLYKAKDHLKNPEDMKDVWLKCRSQKPFVFLKGHNVYAELSAKSDVGKLFAGYDRAYYLSSSYFQCFNSVKRASFIQWLRETTGVATLPRLWTGTSKMHEDFRWLLQNRPDRALDILRRHWDTYEPKLNDEIAQEIANTKFRCQGGAEVLLCETFIPVANLVEKTRAFCDTESWSFLVLSNDRPEEWTFLSRFDVGLTEGINFYLWILKQPAFKVHTSVAKTKNLYCKIQEFGLDSSDRKMIRSVQNPVTKTTPGAIR
jgi:hypothetical protein